LVDEWKIEGLTGVSGASAKAQEYLCRLSERYLKLADRLSFSGVEKFGWLYDREIALAPVI
jgi:acyl-[acyl-carrier-protein] desaturase